MTEFKRLGQDAIQTKGWFRSYKWLLLRRFSQFTIIALFLISLSPDINIIKGSMISSVVLDSVPLSDPFVLTQSVLASKHIEANALIGAAIVALFYFTVGGRVYCSWVCPVNIITDTAEWLRNKLSIKTALHISSRNRYGLLAFSLLLPLLTGTIVWELVNPVTLLSRSIIFGSAMAWLVVSAIFLLDALVSRRAWCGHLCPMGAFYSLLNHFSLLRVNADKREQCNDCMECFTICPEPQVIRPALKGSTETSTVIFSESCTNCGRCIDICAQDVFSMGSRFHKLPTTHNSHQKEVSS